MAKKFDFKQYNTSSIADGLEMLEQQKTKEVAPKMTLKETQKPEQKKLQTDKNIEKSETQISLYLPSNLFKQVKHKMIDTNESMKEFVITSLKMRLQELNNGNTNNH